MTEKKDSTDKRTAILESALALIREHGFHGAPMSQVAKKAGVAAGTLYLYFDSKDQLIRELYTYVVDRMMQAVLDGDHPELPFRDRFFNFWTNHYQFYIKNPAYLLFSEQFTSSPYGKEATLTENEQFRNVIARLFRCGIAHEKLKPIDTVLFGVLIHGSILNAAKAHLSGRLKIGEKELNQIFEIVWDGIKK